MCDTFVATPEATADGRMLFGKNSDREPFEPQTLDVIGRAQHAPGGVTRCTYVDLPSVSRTHAVLLSRPFWMWGAEIGVNDAGVAIGNEAVLTRAPYPDGPGLLGMDILRLALERSKSARRAVEWITGLVEEHGQGGRPSMQSDLRYHNSFVVADAEEAWVVETAHRAWAIARVSGVRSISNGLTLRDDWDACSDGLAARARDWGLSPGKGRPDFAGIFSDTVLTWGAAARRRRGCTEAFLRRRQGELSSVDAMCALRQHGNPDRPGAAAGSLFMTVCGHASWTPTRSSSQTTGSMVCSIDGHDATAWVTATSAPCVSLFKPVWIASGLPDIGHPGARYDPSCLWWRHEVLHRRALAGLGSALDTLGPERDALEADFARGATRASKKSERRALSSHAFERAEALETEWLERLARRPLPGPLHRRFWREIDARCGVPRDRPPNPAIPSWSENSVPAGR